MMDSFHFISKYFLLAYLLLSKASNEKKKMTTNCSFPRYYIVFCFNKKRVFLVLEIQTKTISRFISDTYQANCYGQYCLNAAESHFNRNNESCIPHLQIPQMLFPLKHHFCVLLFAHPSEHHAEKPNHKIFKAVIIYTFVILISAFKIS